MDQALFELHVGCFRSVPVTVRSRFSWKSLDMEFLGSASMHRAFCTLHCLLLVLIECWFTETFNLTGINSLNCSAMKEREWEVINMFAQAVCFN